MLTIVAGVATFTLVILVLVLVLVGAQAKLVGADDVTIAINGDAAHELHVAAGRSPTCAPVRVLDFVRGMWRQEPTSVTRFSIPSARWISRACLRPAAGRCRGREVA